MAGGLAGAGSAYAGLSSGAAAGAAIGSFIPILGTVTGAGIEALTGTLLGFLAGSATGNTLGGRIDTKIRMKYHCTHWAAKYRDKFPKTKGDNMSRLLWFILGGIATAVGAGVAALATEESKADGLDQPEENHESTNQESKGTETSCETGKWK